MFGDLWFLCFLFYSPLSEDICSADEGGVAVFKAEGEGKGSPSMAPLLSITPCLPCSISLNTSVLRVL